MPTRTISNAGGNWNATGTWVEGAVPVLGDDVVATATSGQLTVNVVSACTSIDFTNYVNTLTMTSSLTVSGNVKFSTGMTIAGVGNLSMAASGTWTSNGKVFTGSIVPAAAATITFADDWTIAGNVTHTSTGGAQVWNGGTVNIRGGFSASAGRTMAGTSLLKFTGTTGTSTLTTTAGVANSIEINSTNAVSFSTWLQTGGTITYITSSSITSTAALSFSGTISLNCAGISWNSCSYAGTSTITLLANFNVAGNFGMIANATTNGAFTITCNSLSLGVIQTLGAGLIINTGNCLASSTVTTVNGASAQINVSGNFTLNSSTVTLSGTAPFKMTGTGNIVCAGGSSSIKVNLEINTSGTITFNTTNPIVFNTSTFLITAVGSLVTTGSTLTLGGTLTVNVAGLTFANITPNLDTTINGSQGITITTLICTTAGKTITWKAGNTYNITSSLTLTGTAASNIVFASTTPTSLYTFTLTNGATCDVGFVTVTDAWDTAGRTVWNYKGTISNSVNWKVLPTSPSVIGSSN